MPNLTNSYPLTEFQRNARSFIDGLNQSREPVLLTVNGKVQAVLVDPATYQDMEQKAERQRLIAAIHEGEQSVREGRTRSAEEVYEEMKAKYGF